MVEERDLRLILEHPVDWECFRDKSVLVTGATGRLGMYFVEVLLKQDIDLNLNMKVYAHARNKEKLERVFCDSSKLNNFHAIIGDITDPINIDGKLDYIIHTAGPASPRDLTIHPVETLWGHVMGTRNVLELARDKKVKRVLYVSTVEIYGEWKEERGIKESDMGPIYCDHSRACYPESKRLSETMLASYCDEYGVDYVVTRLSHTFGPGIDLEDGRAFSEFISNSLKGEDIVLKTDGSATRTYTYVSDAVGAMLLALTKGKDKYYNVANLENEISIRDLAELIAKLSPGGKTKIVFDIGGRQSLKYLPFKLGIMDIEKIKALGFSPRVGLNDAFKYTMQAFETAGYRG